MQSSSPGFVSDVAPDGQSSPPTFVSEVAPDVKRVAFSLTNAYLVGNRDHWTLVDAGYAPLNLPMFLAAARACFGEDARPQAIVLTHAHFDHVGCLTKLLDTWGDVPVYAHRLEMPYLNGKSAYPPPDPTVGTGTVSWVLSRAFPTKPLHLAPHQLRALPDQGELSVMPGWQVIPTPGHSPGHVSFFRAADRTLLAGDAVVTTNQEGFWESMVTHRAHFCRPPAYFTQDWLQAWTSVETLAHLKPRVVAAGHGQPIGGPGAEADLRAFADSFSERIPARGRYVDQPAQFDENGVVYTPPPVPDPLPVVAAVVVAALAGWLGYRFWASQNNQRGYQSVGQSNTRRINQRLSEQ